jgi:hypothetical protein
MTAIPEGVMGPSEDGWLPPPTGPSPEAGSEEPQVKVTQAEVSMLVDKIVEGIRKIEDGIAVALKEEGLKANEGELWGYSILIGWAIKKYAMKSDTILLGTAALAIIAAWTVKITVIAKKRSEEGRPLFKKKEPPAPERVPIPPAEEAAFRIIDKQAEGTAT